MTCREGPPRKHKRYDHRVSKPDPLKGDCMFYSVFTVDGVTDISIHPFSPSVNLSLKVFAYLLIIIL